MSSGTSGDRPATFDLVALAEVAEGGIVSKTLVENEHHKLVHFTFAPGQELSEHTASVPAVIHVLAGAGTRAVWAARSTARSPAASSTCRPGCHTPSTPTTSSSSCSPCSAPDRLRR